MKIKSGFVLREIAGTHVVVPIGQNVVELSVMLTLNESGAFIWEQLSQETTQESVVANLVNEYGIDTETATQDIVEFLSILNDKNLMEVN